MEKRRVILVSQSDLLGESLEHILNSLEDVQVIGSWQPDEQVIANCAKHLPDIVIISDNELSVETSNQLTTQLLETIPNLTVIRIRQDSNFLVAYTSHTIPARVADLIDAIHHLPIPKTKAQPNQLRTGR
jgi:DNA-binding NarL/FixJ family response regulator